MNVNGIQVFASGHRVSGDTLATYPQIRFAEVDVNDMKLFWHRANHYRSWVDGWCEDCDMEDLRSVWVLYADCTSRGVILNAQENDIHGALTEAHKYL